MVSFSPWWCGCIWIVGTITFATSFVCNGPTWRMNWIIKRLPNQMKRLSSSQQWWEQGTWKHFGTQKLAKLEWWLGISKWQLRRLRGKHWMWYRSSKWHRGSRNPRAVACECHTMTPRMDSANAEVNETGWNHGCDVQFNGNEVDWRNLWNAGHNVSICFTSFLMLLDRELHLEIYHGRLVSSRLRLSVDK